jgi:hypothetical protein
VGNPPSNPSTINPIETPSFRKDAPATPMKIKSLAAEKSVKERPRRDEDTQKDSS